MLAAEVILKRFEIRDELIEFEKGSFETVSLRGMTIGRATYQPGWRRSVDVGSELGERVCTVEHAGMVVSHVSAEPHDSRVVGDEPHVSLRFLGASRYAKHD
jgi:hypothetical protein